jgi:hypothetical protein
VQPTCDIGLPIELVAVHDEQALPARGAMDPLAMQFKLPVHHYRKQGEIRIVITGNVDEARTGTPFGK